jgi:hypothetical protein
MDTVSIDKGSTLIVFDHVIDILLIFIEFILIMYWLQPIYSNRSSKDDIVGTHTIEKSKL